MTEETLIRWFIGSIGSFAGIVGFVYRDLKKEIAKKQSKEICVTRHELISGEIKSFREIVELKFDHVIESVDEIKQGVNKNK